MTAEACIWGQSKNSAPRQCHLLPVSCSRNKLGRHIPRRAARERSDSANFHCEGVAGFLLFLGVVAVRHNIVVELRNGRG